MNIPVVCATYLFFFYVNAVPLSVYVWLCVKKFSNVIVNSYCDSSIQFDLNVILLK